MKANEAPERICIPTILAANTVRYKEEGSIEYTRTDAFIERADKFIGSFFHPDDTELRNCLLKKFHEYLEGE